MEYGSCLRVIAACSKIGQLWAKLVQNSPLLLSCQRIHVDQLEVQVTYLSIYSFGFRLLTLQCNLHSPHCKAWYSSEVQSNFYRAVRGGAYSPSYHLGHQPHNVLQAKLTLTIAGCKWPMHAYACSPETKQINASRADSLAFASSDPVPYDTNQHVADF